MKSDSLRHFVGAGLIDRRFRLAVIGADEPVGQQIGFHFLAADVGQHVTVDLDARAEHLTAFFDHLLTLRWIVDDIAILEGKFMFAEHGAHALAPTAGGLQVSNDLGLIHRVSFAVTTLPYRAGLAMISSPGTKWARREPRLVTKLGGSWCA